ncbi:peptidoglycan-binding domain-containing protein [Modestobacter marinus]|uniref:peptidoglycan-binding domain-containing protein n=1 Tax=Modestobacter marinus TaxID=477641 RepID=UPI001C97882F|nr:peptidoglycan-binding protein [Modestobacter marinus]
MADPIIKLGSTGEAVKKAQRQLIFRYYLPPGTDDGIFGPVTRNRVIRYQLDRGVGEFYAFSFPLTVDGIVGPQTWFRLAPETVRSGSHGNGVRLLQDILKSFGYPPYDPGPVDGDFGPLTEAAVRAFQGDFVDFDGNPLVVDGIVGPKTWTALWS